MDKVKYPKLRELALKRERLPNGRFQQVPVPRKQEKKAKPKLKVK